MAMTPLPLVLLGVRWLGISTKWFGGAGIWLIFSDLGWTFLKSERRIAVQRLSIRYNTGMAAPGFAMAGGNPCRPVTG